ncbi:MAG: hypothetical protein ACLVKS_05445 [Peptococcus niger]|nr:hypothetical protein [Peptococcus niger]
MFKDLSRSLADAFVLSLSNLPGGTNDDGSILLPVDRGPALSLLYYISDFLTGGWALKKAS